MAIVLVIVLAVVVFRTRNRLAEALRKIESLDLRLQVLETTAASQTQPAPMPVPARPSPPIVVRPPADRPAAIEPERPAPPKSSLPPIPHELLDEPLLGDALNYLRAWLFGGNTVVRVGVVVLLFGVAFFLNFAIDRGFLPVEVRLTFAALGGIALTALGWWLRVRRRDYALVLQGGGIGIVDLTVFAAVNLYDFITPGPGLALMVALVALSSALAVLQDARSLAILATCAGFAAPLIVSSEGSHVGLFSYYTALNLGIVAIAWFKEWRLLNRLGFVFTFVISAAWGHQFYRPDYFSSTEPFLIAFFLLYVAVPVLFATRKDATEQRHLDGSLLFGVPLAAFTLQAGLVGDFEYGLAFSALVAGLFYVSLASFLWRRVPDTARIVPEAFLAFSVAFGTLAIPLAFDGRWTGSTWALEGAGLVWIAVRQRRRLAGAAGILLQFLAGIAFLNAGLLPTGNIPVINSVYVGALLISLAGLFCAWFLHRHRAELDENMSGVSDVMLAWGLCWWFGAGLREIHVHVAGADRLAATLTFTALTSMALTSLRGQLAWSQLKVPVLLQLPVMMLVALAGLADQAHPLVRWGGVAWAVALGVHYWIQWRLESEWADEVARYWHAGMLWLVVFLLSCEAAWVMEQLAGAVSVWKDVAWVLVPAAAMVSMPRLVRKPVWPFARFADAYLAALAPLVIFSAAWVLFATVHPGDPAPLPYVPLVNPLELAQSLVLAILVTMPSRALSWVSARDRSFAGALLAFVVLNGIIARATHFYGGVAFDADALWSSARYQTAISIIWTAVAMAVMLAARTLMQRTVWFTGAALLLVVVVKLFLVDLGDVGTVNRMISFVVVGLLILLVGYLSPLPPRSQEETAP